MTREAVATVLNEFGQKFDIEGVEMDDEDFVALQLPEGVLVNVDYVESDNTLVLYTTVGEIQDSMRTEIYEELLQANFFWEVTAGATMCIDPEAGHALVNVSVGAEDLDAEQFETLLQNVNRITLMWAERFRQIAEAADQPDQTEAADHEPVSFA
ncbi:MAG: type III secretion system chaperone [Hyphomicrobiales bacterium]|nr:type III secretion system chaperone [Hyphomicrobiales bacterium]